MMSTEDGSGFGGYGAGGYVEGGMGGRWGDRGGWRVA